MTLDELKEVMETGEEFEIRNAYMRYENVKFIENHLHQMTGFGYMELKITLNEFFDSDIIRKPWKPKEGESYWYWYPYGGKIEDIAPYKVDSFWSKSMHDLPNLIIGNCFRTKEECGSHTEIRDKLIEMRKEYV